MFSRALAHALVLTTMLNAATPAPPTFDTWTEKATDSFHAEASADAWTYGEEGREPAASDKPRDRYLRAGEQSCVTLGDLDAIESITQAAAGICEDGEAATMFTPACDGRRVEALWVQRARDDGSYAGPEQVTEDQCVTPADIGRAAREEFARMSITPPPATVQGGRPLLVNVHYPAYTSATPIDTQVTLLDVPVTIRAEPTRFTWDFDDPHSPGGGTLTTTDPGRPWYEGEPLPDESWVAHAYTALGDPDTDPDTAVSDWGNHYRQDVTVTLTTTWQGSFRLAGTSDWTTIPGTVETTSTTEPASVSEARSKLVCDDLSGHSSC